MPDENDQLNNIKGPYEKWSFGIGEKYLQYKMKKEDVSFYTGIVSLSYSNFAPQSTIVPNQQQTVEKPIFPTLWGKLDNFRFHFFPVAAKVYGATRSKKIESLLKLRSNIQKFFSNDSVFLGNSIVLPKQNIGRLVQNPAYEETGFRLNVPLAKGTLDLQFRQEAVAIKPLPKIANATQGELEARPKLVIVAVIDDGIAFAHRNFRDAEGHSRIESCWLQSARSDQSSRVLFGREWLREEIDNLIAEARDEEEIYSNLPMSEDDARYGAALRRFSTHGTHVLDIAAGHRHGSIDPAWTTAGNDTLDRVRIIAVQLPPAAVADTAGFGKDAYILSAFHHIFERADQIYAAYGVNEAAQQALVVNFSFGSTGGSHNGVGRVERAIDELITMRRRQNKPTYVTMPAGNTFSSALYGEISADLLKRNTGAYTIPWRVQPNSAAASHLELWFDQKPVDCTLTIKAPGWEKPESLALNDAVSITFPNADAPVGQAVFAEFVDGLWHAVVSLVPTEPEDDALPAAPAGLWQVTLHAKGSAELKTPVCCRIQRSEDPHGYKTGARQSYFDDPSNERFGEKGDLSSQDKPAAFVQRFGSLNTLASGSTIWVVGGFFADTQQPSAVSAAGKPGRPPGSPFVDAGAASDDSRHLFGRRAAATLSGSLARVSGTSVAAPYVARRVALQILNGDHASLAKHGLKGFQGMTAVSSAGPYDVARLGDVLLP